MQINITGHHVEVTSALRAYVTEKMQRISRHFDHVISTNVILKVENHQQQAEQSTLPAKPCLPRILIVTCTLRLMALLTSWTSRSDDTRIEREAITSGVRLPTIDPEPVRAA